MIEYEIELDPEVMKRKPVRLGDVLKSLMTELDAELLLRKSLSSYECGNLRAAPETDLKLDVGTRSHD